jgi:hypothetical protein
MIYLYIDTSHSWTININTGYNLRTKHTRGDSGKAWLTLSPCFQRRFSKEHDVDGGHQVMTKVDITVRIMRVKMCPAPTKIIKIVSNDLYSLIQRQ